MCYGLAGWDQGDEHVLCSMHGHNGAAVGRTSRAGSILTSVTGLPNALSARACGADAGPAQTFHADLCTSMECWCNWAPRRVLHAQVVQLLPSALLRTGCALQCTSQCSTLRAMMQVCLNTAQIQVRFGEQPASSRGSELDCVGILARDQGGHKNVRPCRCSIAAAYAVCLATERLALSLSFSSWAYLQPRLD